MIIFFVLLTAASIDHFKGIIPNWLNLAGLIIGIGYNCYTSSYLNVILRIGISIVVFAVLYLFFMIGCIGAGDIKLIMVMCIYVGLYDFVKILLISLIVAAVISVYKMIKYRILWFRVEIFVSYLQKCIQNRNILPYEGAYDSNQAIIHMAVPLFIGYCIWSIAEMMGGIKI